VEEHKGGWLNENFQSKARKFAGHQKELAKMPLTKHDSSRARKIKNLLPMKRRGCLIALQYFIYLGITTRREEGEKVLIKEYIKL